MRQIHGSIVFVALCVRYTIIAQILCTWYHAADTILFTCISIDILQSNVAQIFIALVAGVIFEPPMSRLDILTDYNQPQLNKNQSFHTCIWGEHMSETDECMHRWTDEQGDLKMPKLLSQSFTGKSVKYN